MDSLSLTTEELETLAGFMAPRDDLPRFIGKQLAQMSELRGQLGPFATHALVCAVLANRKEIDRLKRERAEARPTWEIVWAGERATRVAVTPLAKAVVEYRAEEEAWALSFAARRSLVVRGLDSAERGMFLAEELFAGRVPKELAHGLDLLLRAGGPAVTVDIGLGAVYTTAERPMPPKPRPEAS